MNALRAFFARLRDAFRRRSIVRAFDEEMSFHLAELERAYRDRGASPEEARHLAARHFGNAQRAREDLRAQAGFPTWDELAGDVRHALRGILRRPMLAGSIIAILTLGLGAAATIHGLIDAVFLRPLPVPHPEQLYAIMPAENRPNRVSRGTMRRLEALLPEHSLAAYSRGYRVTTQLPARDAERSSARLVNGSFFAALGVGADVGRLLTAADDTVGAPAAVAVAGHAWAKKNFGVPAAAVGREIVVNRVPLTIVGVLPESFREIDVGTLTDLWLATALHPRLRISGNASINDGNDRPNDPDWNREERVAWLQALVRVRPGDPSATPAVQRAWAVERDDGILAAEDPEARTRVLRLSWKLVASPAGESRFRESFRATSRLLTGVVAVMLVLVCTNVSGLLLVRAMSRHREFGVRLSLGAGSFRVVRLGFIEAAMLSAAGAVGGFFLASWLLPLATRLLAPNQDFDLTLGLRSVLLMSALAFVVALLSALGPALWISRVEPLRALSGNRGLGRAPVRLGRALVVIQFALSVALVAVAAALGGELQRLLTSDPGFERERVMTALFDPGSAGYASDAAPALIERLHETALAVPGVKAVGFASSGILAGSRSVSGVFFRGPPAPTRQFDLQHDVVRPGYFGVAGMPLLLGRDFTAADAGDAPRVAVINAALARKVFGDASPIGQRFGFDLRPASDDWTIVGVVADTHVNGLRADAPAEIFLPAMQRGDGALRFLAVRFAGSAVGLQASLRAALARAEPGLVFTSWKTLRQRMDDDLSGDLATTQLAAIFGGCALLLAGAGIAGSLGYLVVLRQRELALRLAIGAAPGRLLRGVLLDALRLSAAGGFAGLVMIWLVSIIPAVQATLHERPGVTPALAGLAIGLLTALLAGWIPARRAAHIDPIVMLKSE